MLLSKSKLRFIFLFNFYGRSQNRIERLFWAGNQGYYQNFEKNDTSYETQGYFHWKKNLLKKKIKMADQKKFTFQLRQFSIFFTKISWIGSLVSRID